MGSNPSSSQKMGLQCPGQLPILPACALVPGNNGEDPPNFCYYILPAEGLKSRDQSEGGGGCKEGEKKSPKSAHASPVSKYHRIPIPNYISTPFSICTPLALKLDTTASQYDRYLLHFLGNCLVTEGGFPWKRVGIFQTRVYTQYTRQTAMP